MSVDKGSPVPLHVQVRNELLGRILSGELEPGDRLPSERELELYHQVSRTTVRLALGDLVHSGLIQSRPGKGTYVAPSVMVPFSVQLAGFTDDFRKEGACAITSKVLLQETLAAPPVVASLLHIDPNARVLRLKRLRLADEVPVAMDDAFLPLDLCVGLVERDMEHSSLYETLRGMGLAPVRAERMMRADMPNEEEKLLDMEDGVAVMRVEGIAFLSDGRPIEYAKSTYRGDRFRFNVMLGRGGDSAFFQGPWFGEQPKDQGGERAGGFPARSASRITLG